MREATVELGVAIPDYVSNGDLYKALNECGTVLEKRHIEAHNMAVFGLEPEQEGEAA